MTPEVGLTGDALLEAITAGLVVLYEQHFGRKPAAARTQWLGDDLLACVMGGVYTEVEKTLIELQRRPLVEDARSEFQAAMRPRLTGVVERLLGRAVHGFMSTRHVGPDLEIELFVLAPL